MVSDRHEGYAGWRLHATHCSIPVTRCLEKERQSLYHTPHIRADEDRITRFVAQLIVTVQRYSNQLKALALSGSYTRIYHWCTLERLEGLA